MSYDKPENEDLYGDLDKFELERTVLKHEESYKELHEKYNSCLKTIETLKNENKLHKKNITNMERNFASLLLTARTELKRKSMQLDELRKEKDDICFRRNTRHYSKRTGQDSSQPILDERTQAAHSKEANSGHVRPSSNQFRNYTDQNKEHKEIIDTLHKQCKTTVPKTEKITQIKCKTISLNLEGRSPITLKVEDFREKNDKKPKTDDYITNLLTHSEPCLDQTSFKDNENIHLSKTSSGLEICFNKDSRKNLENTNTTFKPVTIYSKRREAEKIHTVASNKEGNAKVAIAGIKVLVEPKNKSIIPEKSKVNENVCNYDLNHKLDEHNIAESTESNSESTKEPETQQNKYNDALFDDFLLNEFERNDSISSESKKSEPKPTSKTNESKLSAFEDFTDSEQDNDENLSKSASNTELQQSRPFQSVTNSTTNEGGNVDNSEGKESQGSLRKRPRSYDFLDLTNSSVNSIELNDLNVTKDLHESQNDLDTSGEDTLFIDVEGLGKTETKEAIQDTDIYNDLAIINDEENVKRIGTLGKVQKKHSAIGDVNKELSGDRNNESLCKDSQGKNVVNTISERCLSRNISSNEKEKSLQDKDIIDKNLKKDQCLLNEGVKNIGSSKPDNQDAQSNNCTLSIIRDNAANSGIIDKDSNTHIEKDIKSPETGDEDVEMPLLTIQTDKRDGGLEIHPYPPGKFKELFSLHTSKEGSNFSSFMASKESVQINSINNEQNKSLTELTNNNETNNISGQVTSVTCRRDEIISELGIFTAIPKTQIHSQTPTYFGDRAQSNNTNKTLEANTSTDDFESDTFDSFNNQLENSAENVANVKRKQTNTVASKTHVKNSVQEVDNENTIEKAQVMFDLYLASPTAPIPSEACLNTSIETKLEKLLGSVGTKKRKSSTPKKTIGCTGRPKKMVGHRIEGFEPITSNKEAIEASKLKNALFEEALKSADSARSGSDATNSSDSLSDCSDKKQEYSKNSEEKSMRDNSLNTEKCLETTVEKSKLDDSKIDNDDLCSCNASTNSLSRMDCSLNKVATETPSEPNENAFCLEKNKEKGVQRSIDDISQDVMIDDIIGKNNNKFDVNENNSPKECEGKSMLVSESVKGTPIAKPARKRRNTTYLDNLKSLSLKSSCKANDKDLQSNKSHRRNVVNNKDIREIDKIKTTRKAGEGLYQESRKQITNEKNILSESILSKASSNIIIDNSQDKISFSENTSHHHKNSCMKIINLENPRDPRLEVKRLEPCRRSEDYSYLIKLKWTHDENTIFSHSSKDSSLTLESKSRTPSKPCSSFTVLANCKQQFKRDKNNEKYHKKISGRQLPQMIVADSYKLSDGELQEIRKSGIRKFMQDFCKTIENVDEETVSDSMSICAGDESSNASIGDSSKNSMAFQKICQTKSSNFNLSKHESKNREIKSPHKVHAKFNIVPGVNYIHKSDISSTKRHNIENVSTIKEDKKVTELKMKPIEVDIFSEIRDDLDKHIKTTKKLPKSKSVEEKNNQVSKKFSKTVHWEDFTKEKQHCKSVSEEITEYLKAAQKVKPAKIKERRKTVDFVTSTGSDLQKRIQIIEDIQICTSEKSSAQDSCEKNETTEKSVTVLEKNLNIIEKRKARNSLDSKLEGALPPACLVDFITKENILSTKESIETKDTIETQRPNTLSPIQNIPNPLNTTENQSATNITDQNDSPVTLLQNTLTPSPQTTGTNTSTSLQVPQYFHTSFTPKRKTVVEVNFCFKNLPVPQSSIAAIKGNLSTVLKPKKRKMEDFHRNTMNKRRKVIYSTMEVEELYKNKKERNLNNISEEELQNAVNMILPRDDYGQTEMKVNTTPKKTPSGHKLTARQQKVAAQSVKTLRKSSRIQEKKLAIEREKKLKGRKIKRRKYTKKPAKSESKNVRALIKKSKNDDELYDNLFNASSEAEPLNISKNNSNVESNFDSDNEFRKVEQTFREMFEKSPEVFTAINTSNNQFLEAIRCPNDDNMKLIKKTANKCDEKIKISSSNNSVITSTSKKTICDTKDKKDSKNSENTNSLPQACSFRRSTTIATKASSRNDKCENKENTAESNSECEKQDSVISQDDLNRSSTQNDSVSERKNISVASSSYIIESVSNNVVNVFITRKKKKKKMC